MIFSPFYFKSRRRRKISSVYFYTNLLSLVNKCFDPLELRQQEAIDVRHQMRDENRLQRLKRKRDKVPGYLLDMSPREGATFS